MKYELPYFKIGTSFGGNQNELNDFIMRMGGCAAVSACDVCIHMALFYNKNRLYPYDINRLNLKDYNKFIKVMKPYLRPRFRGISTLKLYIDGLNGYLRKVNENDLLISEYSGEEKVENAIVKVKEMIHQGRIIPYLLLKHQNPKFKQLAWHWFLVIGYEDRSNGFYIKVATFGQNYWISFSELWNTGYSKKGGLILID